ncbi:hypothetical protein ACHAW5_005068 [Stephanodiscus triporus]|uniref:Uncharacterized protein n=1 Tax=Stephanodiscus triporus TaxID=2934178 RepID=A0ABD3NSZ3_9STRA
MIFSHGAINMALAPRPHPPFYKEGALASTAVGEGWDDGLGTEQKNEHGDGKVAKETEVMTLGVKGVKDSKDGGVEESYGNGKVVKETEVKSLGVEGVKDSKDGGVEDSYGVKASEDSGVKESYGDGNVAKETEVKSLGVKGVKDSKYSGVKDSYVSGDKYAHIVSLSSHQASLIDFLSIPSFCDQGNGKVVKETEVKSLGVEGVKDSKDGGVEDSYGVKASEDSGVKESYGDGNVAKETEVKSLGVKGVKDSKYSGVKDSYVSGDKYAHIVSLSSHQASLIDFLSIPSFCDQGNGKVVKETEVKSLGVEGVKDSKDGGVEDSYGVKASEDGVVKESYGDGKVAREAKVKSLGVKEVEDSKDGGVKESYGDGKVAREAKVKSLGVKEVEDSKDGGVKESYGDGNVAKETEVKSLGVKGVKDSKYSGVKDSYGNKNLLSNGKKMHLNPTKAYDQRHPFDNEVDKGLLLKGQGGGGLNPVEAMPVKAKMVGGKGVICPIPKNETPKVYYVGSLAYHFLILPIVLTNSYSSLVQFHGVKGKGGIVECLSVPKFMTKMLVLLCLVVGCQGQEAIDMTGDVVLYHESSIYDAEYHIRTKNSLFPADHFNIISSHLPDHFNIISSHLPDHFNQGHHRARLSRKDGGHRRRLAETGEICVDLDKLPTKRLEYKRQQCQRLLDCVDQYSLYDLFAYFFADDIGASGVIRDDEKVKVWDERYLVGPDRCILDLLGVCITTQRSVKTKIDLLKQSLRTSNFSDADTSWVEQCDDLLEEFHTFDEEAGESGRWRGGTVTQVCKGWSTSKYISFKTMIDLLDKAGPEITDPEKVIVEIFDEFAQCATGLAKKIADKIDPQMVRGLNLFRGENPNELNLISGYTDSLDIHGHLVRKGRFLLLDDALKFDKILACNNCDGVFEKNVLEAATKAEIDLRKYAIQFEKNECKKDCIFGELNCLTCIGGDDCDNKCGEKCLFGSCRKAYDEISIAESAKERFTADKRWASTQDFDNTVAFLFGNKTTPGQVCAYNKALSEKKVTDISGFCCIDAPYESVDWGEKYSCLKYVKNGTSTKLVQKNQNDCRFLAPTIAGFNEAACQVYQGKWCPFPRTCEKLVKCLRNVTDGANDTKVFLEYLKGAPNVTDDEFDNVEKCGQLRSYFEYDSDYPDDERICAEVRDLQCLTDFSDLDGSDEIKNERDGPALIPTLKIDDSPPRKLTKKPSDAVDRVGLPSSIDQKKQQILDLDLAISGVQIQISTCNAAISAIPGTATPCFLVFQVILLSLQFSKALLNGELLDLEKEYKKKVDGKNAEHQLDLLESTYENVNKNHANIITTFKQLKLVAENLNAKALEDSQRENRFLQLRDCESTVSGFKEHCNKPSCEDRTRLCDGSWNYLYIATLEGAGCDGFDSDGDGKTDVCEDRFPPELYVRNPEKFRCDDSNYQRLCHRDKVFRNEQQLKNFMEYQFYAIDDCQLSQDIEVKIDYKSGSCSETVYTVMPQQTVPGCNGTNPVGPFNVTNINPLFGSPREVTVQLDAVPPVVTCGFKTPGIGINQISSDLKTLYHYILDDDKFRLNKAQFFHRVTDNCDADVQVKVVVNVNELHQNKKVDLLKHTNTFQEQVEIVYPADSCGAFPITPPGLCEKDPEMKSLPIRFYEITVTVSDSAGNAGKDTCKVVIIPSCNEPTVNGCSSELKGGKNYYDIKTVDSSVEQSHTRYHVDDIEVLWSPRATERPTRKPTPKPTKKPTAKPISRWQPTTKPTKKPTNKPMFY